MPRTRGARPAPAAGATPACILVVDDSADTLELIQRNLALQGYDVHTSQGAADALALLDAMAVDLVVTDVRMPGLSGIDLIREVRQRHPGIELVVITGYATIQGAVEALQLGAWDYLAKPFTDEELFQAVRRALARRPAVARPRREGALIEFHGLLGRSRGMTALFESIGAVAPGEQAVLLCGEPGTGREAVARALHGCSGRRGSFVRVSLDARRLAPQGATSARALAELAASCGGGTLYLAALDVADREVLDGVSALIGGRAGRAAGPPARLVASVTEEPAVLQQRGGAMAGLLPRFEAIVAIPPLRERGEDVVLMARRFLAEAASDAGTPARGFSEDAELALRAHTWPGNVRELRDLCVRLAGSGGSGLVGVEGLPAAIAGALGRRAAGDLTLQSAEREHISRILRECGGNKSRAAEILGIDRKTLRDRLRETKGPSGHDPQGR